MTDRATASADLEVIIGRVLRTGVAAATAFLVLGLALGAASPAASGWCLRVGLIVLMATPATRVVASIVEYASARDWAFVDVVRDRLQLVHVPRQRVELEASGHLDEPVERPLTGLVGHRRPARREIALERALVLPAEPCRLAGRRPRP